MTEQQPQPASQPTRVPDVAISLIRTWVPMAVGGLITGVASRVGFVISPDTSVTVGIAVTAACAAGYYGLARAFEAARGAGRAAGLARGAGRYMLGGLVSKPTYLSEAEYAKLMAVTRSTKSAP